MSEENHIYIIVGEHSGDKLGASIMSAIGERSQKKVRFSGIGGPLMTLKGFESLFPMQDIAVMGTEILMRLPLLIKRVYATVADIIEKKPDVILVIDSPEFTHAVASRVKKRWPEAKVVNYVCPSVWAWRSGRAKKMNRYIDRVLALLPFEPQAVAKLNGPETIYVGHPLLETVKKPLGFNKNTQIKRLLILPGSRRSEIKRLLPVFSAAVNILADEYPHIEVKVPTVPHLQEDVQMACRTWRLRPQIIIKEEEKEAAMWEADVALAASGTVSLELALHDCPMVVAYRVEPLAWTLRFLVNVPFISLPNLILNKKIIPERLQKDANPVRLARDVMNLLEKKDDYQTQRKAFTEIAQVMALTKNRRPNEAAADAILEIL